MKLLKNYWAEIVAITTTISILSVFIWLVVYNLEQAVKEQHTRYDIWCKVTGNTHNLTYQEWRLLQPQIILQPATTETTF